MHYKCTCCGHIYKTDYDVAGCLCGNCPHGVLAETAATLEEPGPAPCEHVAVNLGMGAKILNVCKRCGVDLPEDAK